MDFTPSPRVEELKSRIGEFMDRWIYPAEPERLTASIREFLKPTEDRKKAIGLVVPHAGYMYSGHVAGAVYSRVDLPQRNIVLCPNHTGLGVPMSIMKSGAWETPRCAA